MYCLCRKLKTASLYRVVILTVTLKTLTIHYFLKCINFFENIFAYII